MAKRILKLAFAMGGGVSLGAFSGSALTEAIKLALLRIVKKQADYEDVEIDVFSGASAGSLALAVMLRALTWRTADEEKSAQASLRKLHPEVEWDKVFETEHGRDLIATQVAQDLQEKAWVRLIDLKGLLGEVLANPKGHPNAAEAAAQSAMRREGLRWSPGLLDSEAVYEIARSQLFPPAGALIKPDRRRLLSERCLYACTLTSLTAFTSDATDTFNISPGSAPGLRDALRSKVHRDLRVFDIHFSSVNTAVSEQKRSEYRQMETLMVEATEAMRAGKSFMDAMPAQLEAHMMRPPTEEEFHPKWMILHPDVGRDGIAWDLRQPQTWAIIAATAIASGAFPGAFSPVVLNRYRWEYGHQWPKHLEGTAQKTHPADSHPFAFVDGGVFNNDPIREAYRMASFMDAQPRGNIQVIRRLIYVDPAVAPGEGALNIPALAEVSEDHGTFFNFWSPDSSSRKSTLPRVLGLLTQLISGLVEQGRAREADGLAHTRNNFQLRDRYREAVKSIAEAIMPDQQQPDEHVGQVVFDRLKDGCTYCLARLYLERLPPGAGSPPQEMARVLRELNLGWLQATPLEYLQTGFKHPKVKPEARHWLYAHLCLYFDLVLGLEGKNEQNKIIAITPYWGLTEPPVEGQLAPLKLLGDGFAAFAGFMSEKARQYDFEAGRYCATLFLQLDAQKKPGTTSSDPVPLLPDGVNVRRMLEALLRGRVLRKDYRDELIHGIQHLRGRVEQVARDGLGLVAKLGLPLVGWLNNLDGVLEQIVDDIVAERYRDAAPADDEPMKASNSFEILIALRDSRPLELDGKGLTDHDGKPRDLNRAGGWQKQGLFTHAEFVWTDGGKRAELWKGGAVREGHFLKLEPPGPHLHAWGQVRLPDAKRLREELLPLCAHLLRPVLLLDLTQLTDADHAPESLTHSDSHWKAVEYAIPLSEHLLRPPTA